MTVTQISIGRFHHFHLARQMEKHNLLDCIWTGYLRYKLRDEQGIPADKICTFPWLHSPYMARGRYGMAHWMWLNREWRWWAQETLDRYVASHLKHPTTLIALSGTGLHAGMSAQRNGGRYVCDRGSSHIRFQDQLLREEYKRWGLVFEGIDPRIIAKEEAEYEQADLITVPSEFVRKSFIEMGVPAHKLSKVVYGARLDRFHKVADQPKDKFTVLWVGSVGIRKGFLDLYEAFRALKHPQKELIVVGEVEVEMKSLISSKDLTGITFMGSVPNQDLPRIYSTAHVFVLPSIEDGFGMVQGEALACGCPVIASSNTGAEDLFTDGVEGFIVPIRSPKHICERLQQLADDPVLQSQLSEAAISRVAALKGWDTYGNTFANVLTTML
ncbi:glycosyltransferase family 4 protein [Spirosoma utsteinense]|uniref:Glycosyltransferase involved in cell wall biosynthesis n=1 Tax=Spirosoma utsteinense TaxID=2585773 RepID=A0ABR6WEF3_9BACT|nr:glycosyltransferase family 4 protein [Spirosoma utsteinense]MBC3788546.1 glycosyltransferase involved in cell wall biosynthesis [Spirosoma utsteinense]MBC3794563.1 glycosyltransferase involved in cell wall biosynthesis [Spirosoma utsteinense]